MGIRKRRLVFSGSYRRNCLAKGLGFGKKSQHNHRTSEIKMVDGYIEKMKKFLASADSLVQFKEAVDNVELRLRGGDIVTQDLNSGLKLWDAGKTGAQTINVLGETALGTHAFGEAPIEWRKGHYFCCVCSEIACSCFYLSAAASLIPSGYGIWKSASKAGVAAKG